MRAKVSGRERRQRAIAATLSPLAAVRRRVRRSGRPRSGAASLLRRWFADGGAARAAPPDPVRIAVLAIDTIGRASTRASFTGTQVRVAVPDEATAAIFRAALSETSRTRATDRLIRIVVD